MPTSPNQSTVIPYGFGILASQSQTVAAAIRISVPRSTKRLFECTPNFCRVSFIRFSTQLKDEMKGKGSSQAALHFDSSIIEYHHKKMTPSHNFVWGVSEKLPSTAYPYALRKIAAWCCCLDSTTRCSHCCSMRRRNFNRRCWPC